MTARDADALMGRGPARETAMLAASDFRTFGTPHLAAMGLTAALSVLLIVVARRARSAALTRAICWALAAALVLNELVTYVYGAVSFGLMHVVREGLPLHICGIGLYLVAWVLVRPNPFLYEVAYFWGLGGTLQAIVTPNLAHAFPHVRFFLFFFNHSGIVVAVLFATVALRMRPRPRSVLRVFVLTNAWMLLVAGANWLLDANYMFLCKPPEGASIFFFLPWPWYILFLEPVGLALCLILYSPFWLAARVRGARPADARAARAAEPQPAANAPDPHDAAPPAPSGRR